MFAGEPPKRAVSGMAGGENEIGLRKSGAGGERGPDPADESTFPGEGNPVDLHRHPPPDRFGQAERLVFMAGLAISEDPDRERSCHRRKPVMEQARKARQGTGRDNAGVQPPIERVRILTKPRPLDGGMARLVRTRFPGSACSLTVTPLHVPAPVL